MIKPINYREIAIKLPDDSSVLVAALAKPNYCGQESKETFQYLMNQDVRVVYGLEAHSSFIKIAADLGLKYIDFSIPDFTAPDMSMYDDIYDEMYYQARLGKKIAIHCHGGMGRTGTVLTALKLKEMSMLDSFYHVSAKQNLDMALSNLRKLPGNKHIVEVEEQEDSLLAFIEKLFLNRSKIYKP